MPDDDHKRGKAIANTDVFKDAADDVGHLFHRESGMLPDRWRCAVTIQLQPRSRSGDRGLMDMPPSGRQPREHNAQD